MSLQAPFWRLSGFLDVLWRGPDVKSFVTTQTLMTSYCNRTMGRLWRMAGLSGNNKHGMFLRWTEMTQKLTRQAVFEIMASVGFVDMFSTSREVFTVFIFLQRKWRHQGWHACRYPRVIIYLPSLSPTGPVVFKILSFICFVKTWPCDLDL